MTQRFAIRHRVVPLGRRWRSRLLGPYPRYMAEAIWREREEAFSPGKFSSGEQFYRSKHADQRWFPDSGRHRRQNGWLRYA